MTTPSTWSRIRSGTQMTNAGLSSVRAPAATGSPMAGSRFSHDGYGTTVIRPVLAAFSTQDDGLSERSRCSAYWASSRSLSRFGWWLPTSRSVPSSPTSETMQ